MNRHAILITLMLASETIFAQGVDAPQKTPESFEESLDLRATGKGSGSSQQTDGQTVKDSISKRKENTHDSTAISDKAPPSIKRPQILLIQ